MNFGFEQLRHLRTTYPHRAHRFQALHSVHSVHSVVKAPSPRFLSMGHPAIGPSLGKIMITRLDENAATQRAWNGRGHAHHGRIPLSEKSISLSLTWKRETNAKPSPVGRLVLNLPALAKAGFVREIEGHYVLRFQRSRRTIEIARNGTSPALPLGPLPLGF